MSKNNVERFMRIAISLAKHGKGKTAPNPCVGAVLVQNGLVVATGYHQKYGGPHAERLAIASAKARQIDLSQCSLFVTLEPCNHTGKTPPCTQAILEAKIPEVYIGTKDPNPSVAGGGAEFLRQHGVKVQENVLAEECRELIKDFYCWKVLNRPFFWLKLATTLDGKIAASSGDATWISGPKAREQVHLLRSQVNGVMVGGNTFKTDDPRLTVRKVEVLKQPKAIILFRTLPKYEQVKAKYLFQKRAQETLVFALDNKSNQERAKAYYKAGIDPVLVRAKNDYLDLQEVARWLLEHNFYYTLVEGGGFVANQFLVQQLVDELWYFLSPKIMGDKEGVPSFWGRKVSQIDECINLKWKKIQRIENDLLLVLEPKERGDVYGDH